MKKSSRHCKWTLYPRGSKFSLFMLYRQLFSRYGPFFKIAIFGHETWNWKQREIAYMPLDLLSTLGDEIELIFALRPAVFEIGPILKIATFGHKIWSLKKGSNVAYEPSFYSTGLKLILFSPYEQRFLRYGPIFKNCHIFGHET